MTSQTVLFVVARAENGVIGRDGALPWHLPADLRRFKALTTGLPMVMGRRTFESFPAPLPGRRHVVLTRNPAWRAPGAEVAHDAQAALAIAAAPVVAVIGGADIFRLYLDRVDRIELTEVYAAPEGDTLMPDLGEDWHEVARAPHPPADGRPGYAFVTLVRDRALR